MQTQGFAKHVVQTLLLTEKGLRHIQGCKTSSSCAILDSAGVTLVVLLWASNPKKPATIFIFFFITLKASFVSFIHLACLINWDCVRRDLAGI